MTTDTDDLEHLVQMEELPTIPLIGSPRLQAMVLDVFERYLHARASEKARHWQSFTMTLETLMTYVAELEGKP